MKILAANVNDKSLNPVGAPVHSCIVFPGDLSFAIWYSTVLILNFSNLFTTRITSPGNQFTLLSLVTKQKADSKWREKRIYEVKFFFEKYKENMQTLDVYKKEEGKIWQRKPSPSPEEG